MTDYSNFTLEELIAIRIRKAEAANRQIRRWNAAGLKGKPSAMTRIADPYLHAMGRTRYATKKTAISGRTEYQRRQAEIREISNIERLQGSATYSIHGYKRMKQKALTGLARAAGIDIASPEGKRFLEEVAETLVASDQWGWLKRTVGSDVLLEVSRQIAKGNATRDEVLARITEMRAKDKAGRAYVDRRTGEVRLPEGRITKTVNEDGTVTVHQNSIYRDATDEEIYRELGFSGHVNTVFEEFGEEFDY